MKNWQIIGAITLLVLAIAAWRIVSYERERNAPGVVPTRLHGASSAMTDGVCARRLLIDSMKSARVLNGKSIWTRTGYTARLLPLSHRTNRLCTAGRLAATGAGVTGEGLRGSDHTVRLE